MAVLFFAVTSSLLATEAVAPATEPYLRLRDSTLGYHGVSEDFTNLKEIRIGWFGPSDTDDPLHGDFWWAANYAVREANAASATTVATDSPPAHDPTVSTALLPSAATSALPVRLVPCWAPDPWRAGVSLLARMVYDEQPLALIGSVDSASTHLAEQVVAKAQLPLVSPIATDKTATLAGVSWMFSCAPDDTAVARVLVDDVLRTVEISADSSIVALPSQAIASETGAEGGTGVPPVSRDAIASDESKDPDPSRSLSVSSTAEGRSRAGRPCHLDPPSSIVLLTTTDHESRAAAREIVRELSRRSRPPAFRFDLPPGAPDATELLRSVAPSHPAAVIVIANAPDSARLIRTVREQLGDILVFGSPAMSRVRFVELAGPAAEGVRFPLLFTPEPHDDVTARFVARFTAERQHAPDYAAALAYDATRLLIEAIRRSGPNRARIREALVHLSPWSGIAGTIAFDGTGQNRRADLRLGTIRNGAMAPSGPVGSYERERVAQFSTRSRSQPHRSPVAISTASTP